MNERTHRRTNVYLHSWKVLRKVKFTYGENHCGWGLRDGTWGSYLVGTALHWADTKLGE